MFITGFLFGLGFTFAGIVVSIPFIFIKVLIEMAKK